MAQYRYFHNDQLKEDPTTGTKCRTGQLNHQFVEQKFVGGVWVGIGDADGVRYGDVAGAGCRFREGMRDGDYVVDVETEIAGFLLAEGDGWVNCGSVSGGFVELPQKLILTPATVLEEMDATAGWSVNQGTLELNITEKYFGTGSLKVTTPLGAGVGLDKSGLNLDLSGDGAQLELYMFAHTDVITTLNYIAVFISTGDENFTNYFEGYISFLDDLSGLRYENNIWKKIAPKYSVGAGIPDWSSVKKIRIMTMPEVGQIAQCSFDLILYGKALKPAVLITFDDGIVSQYTKAFPLMKAKNMVATCYIISDNINGGAMTSLQLLEMYNNNCDIANHSKTHTNLAILTQGQVEAELNDCKVFLDGLGLTRAGSHVRYPYASYNATVLAAIAAWGGKTGSGIIENAGNDYEVGWPYLFDITVIDNTTTLQAAKDIISVSLSHGRTPIIVFHDIVDSNADTLIKWLTSQFSDLIDWLEFEGIQTLTIDEYYRLYSGPIHVRHK